MMVTKRERLTLWFDASAGEDSSGSTLLNRESRLKCMGLCSEQSELLARSAYDGGEKEKEELETVQNWQG